MVDEPPAGSTPHSTKPRGAPPYRASARQGGRSGSNGARLILNCYSHQQVAEAMKVSVASVRRAVGRAIEERRLNAPERYTDFRAARLTKAQRSAEDPVERGDMRAITPFIRLVGALDLYHGFDPRYRREPEPDAGGRQCRRAPVRALPAGRDLCRATCKSCESAEKGA